MMEGMVKASRAPSPHMVEPPNMKIFTGVRDPCGIVSVETVALMPLSSMFI